MNYKKTLWIDKKEIENIPTSEYWNNKDIELKKIWSIPDDDYNALEKKFLSKGLFQQFKSLTFKLKLNNKVGASLAAGNCILESFIVNHNNEIKKLYCLEMSEHRIHEYAPKVLNHYKVNSKSIELCLGSFYELKFKNNSLDFILLSQAFHHADNPIALLNEIKRVIKDDGHILILGEHFFNLKTRFVKALKHIIKFIINYKSFRKDNLLIPSWKTLFPGSITQGDIHYSTKEYFDLFNSNGFKIKRRIFRKYGNQGFILQMKEFKH
jgi:ubiquinone/menaquinone biosynthesis C-methylase UbiE